MTEKEFLKAYDQHADAIFRHCYFRCFDRELARDLVQETFIRTWEYARGKQIDNVRAFLYRVATNLVIDNARKKKELSLDDLKEQGFDPVINSGEMEADVIDRQVLRAALGKLPEAYRQALMLRYIDDLAPAEIGEILDEPANTISVRIHRGLKQLKEILGEKYDEKP